MDMAGQRVARNIGDTYFQFTILFHRFSEGRSTRTCFLRV
jgi:hypothetical protein